MDEWHQTPHGMLYMDPQESPQYRERLSGSYEREKCDAISKEFPNGGVFVDVGANRGYFTLLFANLGGEVHSIEPEPHNMSCLRRAVVKNGLSDVILYNIAASSAEGMGELRIADKSGMHTISSGPPPTWWNSSGVDLWVGFTTLDNILGDQKIDCLKIDVEGHELYVLMGASRILKESSPTIFLDLHPDWFDGQLVLLFLKEAGYSVFDLSGAPIKGKPTSGEVVARRC